jgi:hypothetical protein
LVFRITIKLNFKYKYHQCEKKICECPNKKEVNE